MNHEKNHVKINESCKKITGKNKCMMYKKSIHENKCCKNHTVCENKSRKKHHV